MGMFDQSRNPALTGTMDSMAQGTLDSELMEGEASQSLMTVNGSIQKTGILFVIVLLMGSVAWYASAVSPGIGSMLTWGGMIVGFILAMVTIFKKEFVKYTAPAYAVFEGLFLGGISYMYAGLVAGIVPMAAGITAAIVLVMLVLYGSRIIPVTEKFKMGVAAATGAIMLVYLVGFAASLFGFQGLWIHNVGGGLGIIISVVILVIAALNLILDFDFFEKGEQYGLPKDMEWYAAFSIMITIVWIYLEVLRLLLKIAARR